MKRVVAIGAPVRVTGQTAPVFGNGNVDDQRRIVEFVYPAYPESELGTRGQIQIHVRDAESFGVGSIWRLELRSLIDVKQGEQIVYEVVDEPDPKK